MQFRLLLVFVLLLGNVALLVAQAPHFQQHELYHVPTAQSEADYDAAHGIAQVQPATAPDNLFLRRTVYGFHPGWRGTAYQAYDLDLISVVAYYGYIVDPATGSYEELYFWKDSPLIDQVKEADGQVELVVATGTAEDNRQLLSNPQSVRTLRDSLMSLLRLRNGHGFCLDFENLPPDQSEAFTDLVSLLSDTLRTFRRRPSLTITLPATDPNGAFDIGRLKNYATQFVVKPYAHPLPSTPAAIDPMRATNTHPGWEGAFKFWQEKGLPKEMMLLGMPGYGMDWGRGKPSPILWADSHGEATTFGDWDSLAGVPRVTEDQRWLHNRRSLGERMDQVYKKDLGGIAVWALGYDHGFQVMHDLVAEKLTRGEASSMGVETDSLPPGWLGDDGGATRLRNRYNWIWMMGGMVGLLVILFLLKRFWK